MTYFFFKRLKIVVNINNVDIFTLEFSNTPFATTGGENEPQESNIVTSIFGLADIELTQWFRNHEIMLHGERITSSYLVPFAFSNQVIVDDFTFNEGSLKTKFHGSLPYGEYDSYDYDVVGQLVVGENSDITNELINDSKEDFILKY